MYGVPGFETSENREDITFERISEDEAIATARIGFDTEALSATRLDTERDDSFRLTTTRGDRVLKVAHPADDASVIGPQLRALEHAAKADPELPLQRIVRTNFGGPLHLLDDGRVSWMFEWLPGTLLRDAGEGPPEFDALGTALGRLSRSLRWFQTGSPVRISAWDLQHVSRLKKLLAIFPDPAVSEAIARFDARIAPKLTELPMQVIHNDFNPGNVLVDRSAPEFVVGILDFGDVVSSIRVADLAIALAYQMSPLGHSLTEAEPMIAAFDRQVRLTDLELEVLPDLIAGRFAQRILINQWIERGGFGHDAMLEPNRAALATLLESRY